MRFGFGCAPNMIFRIGKSANTPFNLAPFLVNQHAIQQGYVTSEPYTISTRGGFEPQVFLLSDFGYPSYAAMVLAQNRLIERAAGTGASLCQCID